MAASKFSYTSCEVYRDLELHQRPTAKNDLCYFTERLVSWRHDAYSATHSRKERIVNEPQYVEQAPGFMLTWRFRAAPLAATLPEKVTMPGTVTVIIGGVSYDAKHETLVAMVYDLTGVKLLSLRSQHRRGSQVMSTGAWFAEVYAADLERVTSLHHRVLMHPDRVTVFAAGAESELKSWCARRDALWNDGVKATHPMVFEKSDSKPRGTARSGNSRH